VKATNENAKQKNVEMLRELPAYWNRRKLNNRILSRRSDSALCITPTLVPTHQYSIIPYIHHHAFAVAEQDEETLHRLRGQGFLTLTFHT
jgi:hypothetical protein